MLCYSSWLCLVFFSQCFFDGLWVSPFFHSALSFHVNPLKWNPQNATEVQLSMWMVLPFRLPPSPISYFVPLLPVQVSSSSPATSHCPQAHPPPLCPPTTWHLFRFIPISWQTACISTRRAQCSDPPKSMADKSMLSLFSMPLLRSIFFFLLLCCLLWLKLCSIRPSSLSETNCNRARFWSSETDTNVG